jgi:hypothetical protein
MTTSADAADAKNATTAHDEEKNFMMRGSGKERAEQTRKNTRAARAGTHAIALNPSPPTGKSAE